MLEQLLNHIQRHTSCRAGDKVLLAVSGGLDSMVMLDLFTRAGFTIGVAHCNFQLRGDESDGDERLVASICEAHKIPLHVRRFETDTYSEQNGISIQMAARELRYRFFDELAQLHGYQHIATAHHLNDHLETTLLNFVRGTGIDGLTGIPVQNRNIIRPLLFATRREILDYASANALVWREDSSNRSDHYFRNFLRSNVIPLLKQLNPNLEKGFEETAERIRGARALAMGALEEFRAAACKVSGEQMMIDREKLGRSAHPPVVLWEILKSFGFRYDQCKEIAGEHQTGRQFFSETHRVLIDRGRLVVGKKEAAWSFEMIVEEGREYVAMNGRALKFSTLPAGSFTLRKDTTIAQLDADTLRFPLRWRPWKNGDHFRPLGMDHTKKLSDFLIDAKLSMQQKEKVTVLESAGEIVWVVGLRVDDRYKVTASTKRVIIVEEKYEVRSTKYE